VYDDPGLLSQWTWESQAKILGRVYERLIQPAVSAAFTNRR
jgi:hypothetical protein